MTDKNKIKGVDDTEQAEFRAGAPVRSPSSRTLKVRRIGNSLGVVLPKEVLAKLRVGEGDELAVSETTEGVMLSAEDSETAELLRMAEAIMAKRRKVLKALAQ